VLTATIQLFLLNSIAKKQRALEAPREDRQQLRKGP
jgi:hypothetical protein